MKYAVLALSYLLFLGFAPLQAQEMMTARQVTMIDDDKPSLNSDKKEKLSMSVSGRAFHGSIFLPPSTPVKVLSRQSYVKTETVGVTAGTIKRNFTAGLVEVLDGQYKGSKGWMVLEVQDPGKRKDSYLISPPSASKSPPSTASAAVDPNAPDLQPGVFQNTRAAVAGKQIYGVSVVNKGGGEVKGFFEVTVKVGDKIVKTERVRDLRPGGAHSFTFEVSDTHVRNHAPVVITVDPSNTIKEGDESNNVRSATL